MPKVTKESKELAVTIENKGNKMEITESMVKDYLCPEATKKEVFMFLKLCEAQNLNPFINEAYLIKYGKETDMIVGKDTFLKRAESNPAFKGFEAGVITKDKNGEIHFTKGSFYCQEDEKLVGGWAEVKKDNVSAVRVEISLNEYIKKNREGQVIKNWRTMPATMIRKVALVQALREAFPNALSACYISEELSNKDESQEIPVISEVVEEKKAVKSVDETEPTPPVEVEETAGTESEEVPMVETEEGIHQSQEAVINDIRYQVKNCLTVTNLEELWNEMKETVNKLSPGNSSLIKAAFKQRKILIQDSQKKEPEPLPFEEPQNHPEIANSKESNSLEDTYKTKNLTALRNILRTKLHEWLDNEEEIRKFMYQHTKKEVLARLTKPEAIKMLLTGNDEFESPDDEPIDLENASSVVIEEYVHKLLMDSLPDKKDRDTFIQNITGGFKLTAMPKSVAYDAYLKILKAVDEMKKEEK